MADLRHEAPAARLSRALRVARARRRRPPGRAFAAALLAAGLLAPPAAGGDTDAAPVAGGDSDAAPTVRALEPLRRFRAEEARQAVAVDAEHFYAIDDRRIGRYSKRSGRRVASWAGGEDGPIVHLNSGIVLEGRLYCAHSNYPAVPMQSSIEIFDARTLAHLASQPLADLPGSATWIDRRGGLFFVGAGNYAGRGGVPGRGPEHSAVVRFDARWRARGSLAFPQSVVQRFGTRSNSGGAFGPDGLLYATGHDAPELYALSVPATGAALELVAILPAPATGQGIAWDPAEPGVLWTIRRDRREVVASRLVDGP